MNPKILLLILSILLTHSNQKILVSNISQTNNPIPHKLSPPQHYTHKHNFSNHKIRVYPPLGYDYNTGPTWNIICLAGKRGRIPGRLDYNGVAYYSFGNLVYHCQKFYKIKGRLVFNKGMPPNGCKPTGKQSDNDKQLYSTVVETLWGNVPGKAFARSDSNYIHEGMSFYGKAFYWVC